MLLAGRVRSGRANQYKENKLKDSFGRISNQKFSGSRLLIQVEQHEYLEERGVFLFIRYIQNSPVLASCKWF
jgi:hypothetical protein